MAKMVYRVKHNGRIVFLSSSEIAFLKLLCKDIPFRAVAKCMEKSPRTVDGYRDTLFRKLGARSRIGLVLWAIANQVVKIKLKQRPLATQKTPRN